MPANDKGTRSVTGNVTTNKGFLLWWTIHTGIFPVTKLLNSPGAANLPKTVIDGLNGADPKSAWHNATRLKDKGLPSVEPDKRFTARYTIKDGRDCVRLLVREKMDTTDIVLHVDHIGVLSFENSFKFDADNNYLLYLDEASTIVNNMSTDYHNRIGNLTDVIIRGVLLRWLVSRFRIIVRESGGVYYLPNTGPIVEQEILAVHGWMKENDLGQLYSFEIFDTDATNFAGLIDQANNEISQEVTELENKITGMITSYKADMQAGLDQKTLATKSGSYAYTMQQYETALESMALKLKASEGSLGTVLGVSSTRIAMMAKQAEALRERTQRHVQEYRKASGKPAVKPLTKKQKQAKVNKQIAQAQAGRKIT